MQFTIQEILATQYFGNTVQSYLIALLIVFVSIVLARILKFILEKKLVKWAEKTKSKVDDLLIEVVLKPVVLVLTIVGIYIALDYLDLSTGLEKWIKVFLQILIALKVTVAIAHLFNLVVDYYFEKTPNLKNNTNLRYIAKKGISILLWVLVFILIVTNLGYNVNSLIAGLGIGGIAIALAVQNVLGDLLGSISIFIDRPFQIGDYIVLGTNSGTVKSIGMKTTRIKTLQGEELVVPNALLTGKEIQNFRKMKKRRIVFKFGVLYETPLEKVKMISQIVEEVFQDLEQTVLDRVHFATLGDFSLNFEVVYFVETGDYKEYMDIQQSVNLSLMEKFAKEKIEFAYPTQKIFVSK